MIQSIMVDFKKLWKETNKRRNMSREVAISSFFQLTQ